MVSSRSTRNQRRAAVAAIASLCAFGVSSCSSVETACPAIGYSSSLNVEVSGQFEDVADLKLCVADVCAPNADHIDPPGLQVYEPPTRENDGQRWTFIVFYPPEEIVIRAYATDGSILNDTPVSADWKRVGGSAQCGGPHDATVEVTI